MSNTSHTPNYNTLNNLLKDIVKSHVLELLTSINYFYPNDFKIQNVNDELKYIMENIEYIIPESQPEQETQPEIKQIKQIKPIKTIKTMKIPEANERCNARIWGFIYKIDNLEESIKKIDAKFNVSDFNEINAKEFNSKYKIGLQCKKKKCNNEMYCKTHKKHSPHGNYYETPSNELILHYLQDGKFI